MDVWLVDGTVKVNKQRWKVTVEIFGDKRMQLQYVQLEYVLCPFQQQETCVACFGDE